MEVLINDEVIEIVKESNDIVSVVSNYMELNKAGANYLGLCPFHNEKTPSFSVSESRQFYHCFGCGEGGDVINFIMKLENLEFIEAIKFLADRSGIKLEEMDTIDKEKLKRMDNYYNLNKDAARFFYYNLRNSKKALYYFERRNISPKIINKFGLGYAEESWDSLLKYLLNKGYKEEEMLKAGLIGQRKDKTGYYDKFRNRVIFPIFNIKGQVIGFGGRVLDDSMPKYLNSQDTEIFSKGDNLYALNFVKENRNKDKIILVEGYMDVIGLYIHGIKCSVASLGTAFTKKQAELLKRYGNEVYISYDSDKAGIKATERALEILNSVGIKGKVINLPESYDPDDYITEFGLTEYEKRINLALNYIEFHIYINMKKYDLNKIDEKLKFIKIMTNIIRRTKNKVEQELYIEEISTKTGISKRAIASEVYNKPVFFERDKKNNEIKKDIIKLEPAYIRSEKLIIKKSLEDRDNYFYIRDKLYMKSLISEDMVYILEYIGNIYKENTNLLFLSKEDLDSLEKQDILNDIYNLELDFKDNEDLDRIIYVINKERINRERKDLLKKIKEAEVNDEKDKLEEYCIKLMDIDQVLKE